MTPVKTWECWTMSEEDIDHLAADMGLYPQDLTEEDKEIIAKNFIKGLGWALENRQGMMRLAVEQTRADREQYELDEVTKLVVVRVGGD